MDSLGCNYNVQSEFSLCVLQIMILTSSVNSEDNVKLIFCCFILYLFLYSYQCALPMVDHRITGEHH